MAMHTAQQLNHVDSHRICKDDQAVSGSVLNPSETCNKGWYSLVKPGMSDKGKQIVSSL